MTRRDGIAAEGSRSHGCRFVATVRAPDREVKGDAVEVFWARREAPSGDVSILFDPCRIGNRHWSGIRVTEAPDDRRGRDLPRQNRIRREGA